MSNLHQWTASTEWLRVSWSSSCLAVRQAFLMAPCNHMSLLLFSFVSSIWVTAVFNIQCSFLKKPAYLCPGCYRYLHATWIMRKSIGIKYLNILENTDCCSSSNAHPSPVPPVEKKHFSSFLQWYDTTFPFTHRGGLWGAEVLHLTGTGCSD